MQVTLVLLAYTREGKGCSMVEWLHSTQVHISDLSPIPESFFKLSPQFPAL